MGGVNTSPDYVRVMKLGFSTYQGSSEGYVVTITEPTRQGGIVSSAFPPAWRDSLKKTDQASSLLSRHTSWMPHGWGNW